MRKEREVRVSVRVKPRGYDSEEIILDKDEESVSTEGLEEEEEE